jgi:poly-gamma-glutamate synthesis protein (capsule biosynthesis protein)
LRKGCENTRDTLASGLDAQAVDGSGDVTISTIKPASTTETNASTIPYTVDYVAVVSRRLLVRDIAYSDLLKIWNREIDDWGALGSPDAWPIVRATLQFDSGPLDPANADTNVDTIEHLGEWFERERGALAIIPLVNADFHFRTLSIDGVNPLRPGDTPNPLAVTYYISPRRRDEPGLIERIEALLAPPDGPQAVSMTWTGDIILGRRVHAKMVEYGDWAAPFRSIWPELVWADITVGNLECSISDSFETPTDPTTFDFKTDTPAIAGLQLAQIDVLSRANNHSFNFGVVGMDDTTATIEGAGIKHFGMGHDLGASRVATVVELGGATYAFLGYNGISDDWDGATDDSSGTSPMVDWMVVEDVQREVANGHIVIPFFHWGTEYVYDPTEEQRYFAHTAIEAGAALVMGSHPHWVQAVETYQGRPIVYSLGNFVFDQEWSLETKQGMIAHVWMQGFDVRKIDLVPVLIEDYHKPRLMENWEAAPVLDHVWAATDTIINNG